MREIKFRSWNANEKRMVTPCLWINECNLPSSQMCSAPTHPVMQFTGLKDRNGTDIYEGDVVKWDDRSNGEYWRVAIVKIDPSLNFHCFDCPAIENSSAHGHRFHYGRFIYKETEKYLSVIGNIHENPELLEDLK